MKKENLHHLKGGTRGRVINLLGGREFINRLNAMGLISGKELTVISDSFLGGPVTVKFDNTKLAIGHRMASKIEIEVLDDSEDTFNG